jgi:hypothetical protein
VPEIDRRCRDIRSHRRAARELGSPVLPGFALALAELFEQ